MNARRRPADASRTRVPGYDGTTQSMVRLVCHGPRSVACSPSSGCHYPYPGCRNRYTEAETEDTQLSVELSEASFSVMRLFLQTLAFSFAIVAALVALSLLYSGN